MFFRPCYLLMTWYKHTTLHLLLNANFYRQSSFKASLLEVIKTILHFFPQSEHQKGSERAEKRDSWWRHLHAPWLAERKLTLKFAHALQIKADLITSLNLKLCLFSIP